MARSVFELVFRAVDQGASATVAGLQSALGAMPGAATQAGAAMQTAVGQAGHAMQGAAAQAGHAAQTAATSALSAVQHAATQTGAAVQHSAQQAGQAAESMGAKFAKLAAAIGAMGFLKSSIPEFADFESAMLKVQALSGAVGADFDALGAKAKELGATTKYTASEAAAGMSQLAASGYNTTQILNAIGPALYAAAAGGTDLAETADQMTNIMGAFVLEADQAGRVADVLTKGFTGAATTMSELAYAMKPAGAMSKALGYSLEETVAVLQSMANVGFKGEQAGTALRNAMTQLMNKDVIETLKKYNVEVNDAEGNIRKFVDILEDMGKANLGTKVLSDLFGADAGPAMLAILGQGADAIREYEKALLNAAGTAKRVGDHMESGLNGALNRLSAAWSELKNGFGKAIAPFVRTVADALSALANWFSKMPDWAKQALALAAVFATVAGAWGVSKTAIMAASTQIAAAVVGMVGKIQAAFAFLMANPWVAALTAALGLAIAAYKMFGKSALDASKDAREASRKHAKAAEEMGKSAAAINKEVAELKALQKTLLESKEGTDEHRIAEEKLARVLPEANVRIDEQGRALAKLTSEADENNKALTRLIKAKEQEAQLKLAVQLHEQARAYDKAGSALLKIQKHMEKYYGWNQQVITAQQKARRERDLENGKLAESIALYDEAVAALAKEEEGYKGLLRTMAQEGKTRGDVHGMMSRLGLNWQDLARYKTDYDDMLKHVQSRTVKSSEETAEKTKKITDEALKEMTKRWQEYAKQVRDLQDQIAGRERSLAAELREMGRSGMSDLGAWQDRKREAEEYVEAAKKAAAEAQAAFAEGDTITAEAKFKEAVQYADDAKAAYRALNQEVKDGDQVIIGKADALKTAMSGVEEAGRLGVDILKQQKQSAADAMKSIEEDVKKGGLNVAEALTEGMDEAEKKWIEKWQNMRKAAEETGEQVYKVWQNAAGFSTNVNDAFSAGWSKTAEGFRREMVDGAFADFEGKARSSAENFAQNWSISTDRTRGLVIQLADDIKRRLDEATRPREVVIYTREVATRALGGIVGAVKQYARGGKLPGYGGGDRISALLEAGEFVIRKEAVAKFGAGFFDALNSLRLPDFSALMPAPALAAATPAGSSRTVNINLTLPSGDTYQLSADPATADRIEREQARWWSLRSSNRVRRPGFGRTP